MDEQIIEISLPLRWKTYILLKKYILQGNADIDKDIYNAFLEYETKLDSPNYTVETSEFNNDVFEIVNPLFENICITYKPTKARSYIESLELLNQIDGAITFYDERNRVKLHHIPITLSNIALSTKLINKISRLKSAKVIIGENDFDLSKIDFHFDCFLDALNKKKKICGSNVFGCVNLPDDDIFCGWFTYGKWRNDHTWEFDEAFLRTEIESHFSMCPIFDRKKAIKVLMELPNTITIDILNDYNWTRWTYMSNEEKEISYPIPVYVRKQYQDMNHYLSSPNKQNILDTLLNYETHERMRANYEFREIGRIFFCSISHREKSCKYCRNASNEVYEVFESLKVWKVNDYLPIPIYNCENESCICTVWKIDPLKQFLINGSIQIRIEENESEWQAWFNIFQKKFNYSKPKSLLPILTKKQKKLLTDLNIKEIRGNEMVILGKKDLIRMGYEMILLDDLTVNAFLAGFGAKKEELNIMQRELQKFSNSQQEGAYLNKALSYFEVLLKKYSYCIEHNIDPEYLFGFDITIDHSNCLCFSYKNNIEELNSFERLSRFNPLAARFEP